jgi:hypothetical protein
VRMPISARTRLVGADASASARAHRRFRTDGSVLPQVTSKRTLQCVQVTDAPAAIVRSSVRSSARYRPRDNPVLHYIHLPRGFHHLPEL